MKKPGDPYNRDFVLVPKWLFEKAHPTCNKFLLSIFDDDTTDLDGCHDDAQGVAQAQTLIKRLGLGRKERRTVMITVEEVPEFKNAGKHKVNEEAIATLAPVIKKYKNKRGIR
jgi:hypothetical protein